MNFEQALVAHGLMPRCIVPDGKWYRCPTVDKPRKRNGAYLLWADGQRGFYKNFATDDGFCEWRTDKPVSLADQRAMDERIKRLRQQEAKARLRAVTQMREHWESLPILTDWHAYIQRKGLSLRGCKGLRLEGDDLVIPMYRGGKLVSLQNISMDGEKLYRKGCSTRGASFVMRRPRSVVTCLVEGFATGLAVFQTVTNASVVVCFDAQNLLAVAQETQVHGMAAVCADNDWETQRDKGINKGVENGRKAAEMIGCGLAYPEGIKGTDWADALKEWGDRGPAKVRMQIMKEARLVF
ncbi:toprim domain-containing protein [Burkholderia cenocepacia]|uniref:toprim domain-containing protein n=1 Tax=Burkholderia cenocepacia TaxID=95486 RepID=UPI00285D03F3|nr:toprim domain-containing protein [Burkholderia cenocepacia]MDR5660990.1 toprim domain-containing protein [Burkholderia cenocepacia]MDR8094148.1 toprim domain-containing protein [Burkholderia cenocepacia]